MKLFITDDWLQNDTWRCLPMIQGLVSTFRFFIGKYYTNNTGGYQLGFGGDGGCAVRFLLRLFVPVQDVSVDVWDVGEDSTRIEYFQPGFAQGGVPSTSRRALSNAIFTSRKIYNEKFSGDRWRHSSWNFVLENFIQPRPLFNRAHRVMLRTHFGTVGTRS